MSKSKAKKVTKPTKATKAKKAAEVEAEVTPEVEAEVTPEVKAEPEVEVEPMKPVEVQPKKVVEWVVNEGLSIVTPRGVLKSGMVVTPRNFPGGETDFTALIQKKHLVRKK